MQATTGLACERRFLARGAAAGSGAAALAGAIRDEAPLVSHLQIAVCHAEISALFGDYITILKVVSRGLVHGPRPEQNHPTLIEFRKHYRQDVGRYKGSGFVSDASAR